MNTEKKKVYAFLDEIRRKSGRTEPLALIKSAKKRGIDVDYATLRSWLGKGPYGEFFALPEDIPAFICELLGGEKFSSLLDPWACAGAFLSPLVEKFSPARAFGFEVNQDNYAVGKELFEVEDIEWHLGNPFFSLQETKEIFDLIVSSPPFGLRNFQIPDNLDGKDFTRDVGELLFLESCKKLSPNGVCVFVFPPKFFFGRQGIRRHLAEFGLYLDAAFMLPSGTFSHTLMSSYLVVVRKQKNDKLFVGEFSENEAQNAILISNYQERKKGSVLQQGVLVDERTFVGFDNLVAEHEVDVLVKRSGLSPVLLSDIAEVSFLRDAEDIYSDSQNAVFLPHSVMAPATPFNIDTESPNRYRNYIKISLDETQALASYVALFFNSRLGKKVRESLAYERVLKRISVSLLRSATIYLPQLFVQREVVRLNTSISNLSLNLQAHQTILLESPNKFDEIDKKIRVFSNQKEDDILTAWIETLPYPLASILWAYYAKKNTKDKIEHLFHFFEAAAQFIATIFLSVYWQDEGFYHDNKSKWNNQKYQGWYKKASFDNWVEMNFSLASFTRKLLDDKDKREHCFFLFGNADVAFIEMLANKGLLGILNTVKEHRNSWKGHSGIVGENEAIKRLTVLEELLSKLRSFIGNKFSLVMLISPESSKYSKGIHHYQVKILQGSRTPFQQDIVETVSLMDLENLYLLPDLQQEPIELLPLGKMMASPKTELNAFYFYNRTQNKEVRWVSYHFAQEAEIVEPNTTVGEILSKLFDEDSFD